MNYKLVNFRGNSDGIIITIKKGEINDIMSDIEHKINESKEFFKGAKVREIDAENLKEEHREKIEKVLVEKYNMILCKENSKSEKKPLSFTSIERVPLFEKVLPISEPMLETASQDEGNTKLIESTIRSGQIVEYDGNIVVLGDVNPGGILSASGNIIVIGALKGIARAGTDGNTEAVVVAFSLEPTQLKIADIISRKPDEEVEKSNCPEIARIQDGMIVIESYLKRNGKR